MKTYCLTRDSDNQLHVCGTDEAAIDWEKSKGREVIGKIETFSSYTFIKTLNIGPDVTFDFTEREMFGAVYLPGIPSSVTTVNIDPENENYILEDGVFFNKDKTSLILYFKTNDRLTYTVPDTVKRIENGAFSLGYSFKMDEIIVPEGVEYIGAQAFDVIVRNLYLPKSLNNIDANNGNAMGIITPRMSREIKTIFYGGNISDWINSGLYGDVNTLSDIDDCAIYFNYENANNINSQEVKSLESFEYNGGIYKFNEGKIDKTKWYYGYFELIGVKEGVKEIYIPARLDGYEVQLTEEAFYENTEIEKVTLDKYIKTIPTEAFKGCVNLREINLENVKVLGRGAFSGCTSLKEVKLYSNTPGYGYEKKVSDVPTPFDGCTALEYVEVKYPEAISTLGYPGEKKCWYEPVFTNCPNVREVYVINFPDDGFLYSEFATAENGVVTHVNQNVTCYSDFAQVKTIAAQMGFNSKIGYLKRDFSEAELNGEIFELLDCYYQYKDGFVYLLCPIYHDMGLKNFYIPSRIGDFDVKLAEGAFKNGGYTIGRAEIGEGIEELPEEAFASCGNMTYINLENVKVLGEKALYSTRIRSIRLKDIEKIGSDALKSDNLEKIYYSKSEEEWQAVSQNAGVSKKVTVYTLVPDTGTSVIVGTEALKVDVAPYIKNDRTMVPMRAIFEALGAEVSWDDATKTAIGKKGNVEVKITIGENVLYKNGEAITLDCAAEITNDRTMVPVRAISEAFGCTVEWNNETKTVEITN